MKMNNFFTSKIFYVLASIFFAIVLFFNASSVSIRNQGGTQNQGEVYTAALSNVPVELKYNANEYFVSGYNNTANVDLTGYNRLQVNTESNSDSRNFSLVADLTSLKPGVNNVPVRVQNLSSGVNAQIEPSTLTVTIEKRAQQEFAVTPQINNSQIPSGFKIADATTSEATVKVTAGQESIKQIHQIVASLPSDTVLNDDYTGTVTLHAVDSSGKILSAQISPSTVQMHVNVNKPSKTVPIKAHLTGILDNSLSKINTSLSQNTVTISGTEDAISKITEVTANVNQTGVKTNQKITVKLDADNVSVNPSTVDVQLNVVKK